MKKKGFTLIELLAVIVVLAIIALIATPIVMNVIKKANMGAAERSADNYVKAVETLIATEKLDGTPLVDGEYEIDTNGKLTKDGKEYEVEVSGTKPVGGKVTITNGQVDKSNTTVEYKDYEVTFTDGKAAAKETNEKSDVLVLCNAIDPVAQPLFDFNTFDLVDVVVGVKATPEDPYAIGAVYKCNLGDQDRIFYVLNTSGNKVSLLMSENLGTSAWANEDDTSQTPVLAKAYLESQTTEWKELKKVGGTVDLPSAEILSEVAGNSNWNENMASGYETLNWMSINLDARDLYTYWTSTYSTVPISDPNQTVSDAWVVMCGNPGSFYHVPSNSTYTGVRPMITISKDNMSL